MAAPHAVTWLTFAAQCAQVADETIAHGSPRIIDEAGQQDVDTGGPPREAEGDIVIQIVAPVACEAGQAPAVIGEGGVQRRGEQGGPRVKETLPRLQPDERGGDVELFAAAAVRMERDAADGAGAEVQVQGRGGAAAAAAARAIIARIVTATGPLVFAGACIRLVSQNMERLDIEEANLKSLAEEAAEVSARGRR